jgi:tetratricopeptide repeat protein
MFDIWMRLLAQVPSSVLWLVNDGEHVRANLRAQAARRGINGGRLVFAGRCAYGDYLARYRLADLFLDTLPFNAGTTASDALWAGLPVLTQTGRSFAGRMAASLLHAVGLPELVTQTADEYEALALRLATHAQELAALRQRLNQQGRASALFDTARLTRHLEQALLTMCQRQQQGLPPQGFDVPALPAA